MPNFNDTVGATPFGFFDDDPDFIAEADAMVNFVKRKMGDDVLSVELTKKEIWACFEEACCEYSRKIHEMKIQSELSNLLGMPTGSGDHNDSDFGLTNKYPHQTLEFLMRQAAPYATYAGLGGSYDAITGYIKLETGRQDYNIFTELVKKNDAGDEVSVFSELEIKGPMKVLEIFHVEPLAAQHFLLNASNLTNFLATNFNYESYVNSTVFYVLPVFEDLLRRGMLETAFRVRRSNYSYELMGSKLRIYPIPISSHSVGNLFIKVQGPLNPMNANALPEDDTLNGVSGPQNVPYGNIPFSKITQPGRQWIRQYTLALSRELLGLIRSKFQSIPIPNADLSLNGENLVSTAREDKERLLTQLKEFLDTLTNAKQMEQQATMAEMMNKQLKYIPMMKGKSIIIG